MTEAPPPRVLVLVDAPSLGAPADAAPLSGAPGKRLERIVGIRLDRLLAPFDLAFLSRVPTSRGDAETWAADAVTARDLLAEAGARGRPCIVAVGQRAADAMGLTAPAYFRAADVGGVEVWFAPHPSSPEVSRATTTGARRFWKRLHRRESQAQGVGLSTRARARRSPDRKPRKLRDPDRPAAEVQWLEDLAEDTWVQTMSVSLTVRALVKVHSDALEAGAAVRLDDTAFVPTRPLSRNDAGAILRRVRDRFAERSFERLEEKREKHMQAIGGRIGRAAAAGAWTAVANLHRLLAEIDGVVGRPDERQAALQVSIAGGTVAIGGDGLDALSDDELALRARRVLTLPPATTVDAVAEAPSDAPPT